MEMDELYLDVFQVQKSSADASLHEPKAKKQKIDAHPWHDALSQKMKQSTKTALHDESSFDIYGDLSMDSITPGDTYKSSPVKYSDHGSSQKGLVEKESKISNLDLFTEVLTSDLTDKEKMNRKLKETELMNSKLLEENKELKQAKEQLSKNISSLFVTSRRELMKKAKELKVKEEEIIQLKKMLEQKRNIDRSPSKSKSVISKATPRQSSGELSSPRSKSKLRTSNEWIHSESRRDSNWSRQHDNNRHKASRDNQQHSDFESVKVDAPVSTHSHKSLLSNSKSVVSHKYTAIGTETVVHLNSDPSVNPSTFHRDNKSQLKDNTPTEKTAVAFDLRNRLKRKLPEGKGGPNEQSLNDRERQDPAPKTVLSGKHTENPMEICLQQIHSAKEHLPPVVSKGEVSSKTRASDRQAASNLLEKKHHSEIRDRLQNEINQSYSLSTCQGVAARRKTKETPVPCQNSSEKENSKCDVKTVSNKQTPKKNLTTVSLKKNYVTKITKTTKCSPQGDHMNALSEKVCAFVDSPFKRRVKASSPGEGKQKGSLKSNIVKLKPTPSTHVHSEWTMTNKNSQVTAATNAVTKETCYNESNFTNDHKQKRLTGSPEQRTNAVEEGLTVYPSSVDAESTRKEKIEVGSQHSPSGESSSDSPPTGSASRGTSSPSTPENWSDNDNKLKLISTYVPREVPTLSTSAVSDHESSSALSNLVIPFSNSTANPRSNFSSSNQTWPFEVKDTENESKSGKEMVSHSNFEPNGKVRKPDETDTFQDKDNIHTDSCDRAFPVPQNGSKHIESGSPLLSSSFVDIETVDNQTENHVNNYFEHESDKEHATLISRQRLTLLNSNTDSKEKEFFSSPESGKDCEVKDHIGKFMTKEFTPEKVPKILKGPEDVGSLSNDSDRSGDNKSSSSQSDKNSNCSGTTESDKYSASSVLGTEDDPKKDGQYQPKLDSIVRSIAPGLSHTSSTLSYSTNITCTSNLIVLGDEETTCTTFSSPFKAHHLPSEFYPPGVRGHVKEGGSHARHIRGGTEVIQSVSVDLQMQPPEPLVQPQKTDSGKTNIKTSTTSSNKAIQYCRTSAVEETKVPKESESKDDVARGSRKTASEVEKGEFSAEKQLSKDNTSNFESNTHQDWISKTFEHVFKKDIPSFKQEMASKSESGKKMLLKNLQNSELLKEHSKTKAEKIRSYLDDTNHQVSDSKKIGQAALKQTSASGVEDLEARKPVKEGEKSDSFVGEENCKESLKEKIKNSDADLDLTAAHSNQQDSILVQTLQSSFHGASDNMENPQDTLPPPKRVCKFVFKPPGRKSQPASPMPHCQMTPRIEDNSSNSSSNSLKEISSRRKNPTPMKIERSKRQSLQSRDLQSPSVGDEVIKDLVSSLGVNWQDAMERDLSMSLDSPVSMNGTVLHTFSNSNNSSTSCSNSQPVTNRSTLQKLPHLKGMSESQDQKKNKRPEQKKKISDSVSFTSIFPKSFEPSSSKQMINHSHSRVSPENCIVTSSDYQSEDLCLEKNSVMSICDRLEASHDHEPDSTSDPPSTGDTNINSRELNLSFETLKPTEFTTSPKQCPHMTSPDSPTKEPKKKAPRSHSPQDEPSVLQSVYTASIPLSDQLSLTDEYTSEEEEENRLSQSDRKRVFDWCQSASENNHATEIRSSSKRVSSPSSRIQKCNQDASPVKSHEENNDALETRSFHGLPASGAGFRMPERSNARSSHKQSSDFFKDSALHINSNGSNSSELDQNSLGDPSPVKLQQKIGPSPVKLHDEISMMEASLSEFDNDVCIKKVPPEFGPNNLTLATLSEEQSQQITSIEKEPSSSLGQQERADCFPPKFSPKNSKQKENLSSQVCEPNKDSSQEVSNTNEVSIVKSREETLKRRTKLKPLKILSRHLTFQELKEFNLVSSSFVFKPGQTDSEYSSESEEVLGSQSEQSQKDDKLTTSTKKFNISEENWMVHEDREKMQYLSNVKKVTRKLDLNLESKSGNNLPVIPNLDTTPSSPLSKQGSNDSDLSDHLNLSSPPKNKQNQPLTQVSLSEVSSPHLDNEDSAMLAEDGEILDSAATTDRHTVENDKLPTLESRQQITEVTEMEEGEISEDTFDQEIETNEDARSIIQNKRFASVSLKDQTSTKTNQPSDGPKQESRKLVHIGGGASTSQYIEFEKKDNTKVTKKDLKLLRNRKKIFPSKIASGHRVSPLDLVHEPDTKSYETEEIDPVFNQRERKRRPPLQLDKASKFERNKRGEKTNLITQRKGQVTRRTDRRENENRFRDRPRKGSRDGSKEKECDRRERDERETRWSKKDRGNSGHRDRNTFQRRPKNKSRDLSRERNRSRDRIMPDSRMNGQRRYGRERNFATDRRNENERSISGSRSWPSKNMPGNVERRVNTERRPTQSQNMQQWKDGDRGQRRCRSSLSSPERDRYSKSYPAKSRPSKSSVSVTSYQRNGKISDSNVEVENVNAQEGYPPSEDELKSNGQDEFGYFSDDRSPSPQLFDRPQEREYESGCQVRSRGHVNQSPVRQTMNSDSENDSGEINEEGVDDFESD